MKRLGRTSLRGRLVRGQLREETSPGWALSGGNFTKRGSCPGFPGVAYIVASFRKPAQAFYLRPKLRYHRRHGSLRDTFVDQIEALYKRPDRAYPGVIQRRYADSVRGADQRGT